MHRIIGIIVLVAITLTAVPVYATSGCVLTKTTVETEIGRDSSEWPQNICFDEKRYCEWMNHPDPECEEVDCKALVCFLSTGSVFRTSWSCGANPDYKSSSETTTTVSPLACGQQKTCYSQVYSPNVISLAAICLTTDCVNCSADAFQDMVDNYNFNYDLEQGHEYDVSCTVYYCDCNTGGDPECIAVPCSYPW